MAFGVEEWMLAFSMAYFHGIDSTWCCMHSVEDRRTGLDRSISKLVLACMIVREH